MNCMFFGDWPSEFDFCTKECPIWRKCVAAQSRKYPLECWRVVAARYKRERWVEATRKK